MKKKAGHKIDRSAVMRDAARLMRDLHVSRSDAMKMAWAMAKGGVAEPRQPKQQESGVRAALKRYGVNADALAARAVEAVRAAVTAIAPARTNYFLPPPSSLLINLTRGADGVYRIDGGGR